MEAIQELSTEKSERVINGVNVTKMAETIGAIKAEPTLADFEFRAQNRWIEGGLNQITISGYSGAGQEFDREKPFSMNADEPPVLLGKDRGANPVEYVLAALSGCMTTSLVYHAAAEGIEIDHVDSNYEGDINMHGFLGLDPQVRKGYSEIRVNFNVKSEADREKLIELIKKSPVYDIITNPTPIKINIEKI